MNHIEFISKIEGVYGQYSGPEKVLVAQYIKNNVPESGLEDLFKRVIVNVDTAFKTPPSVKKINGMLPKKSVESEAVEAWSTVCKYSNPYNDIIFDNPAIHYGLQMAGGWSQFCFRTKEDDIWFKKRFIEAYKRFKEEGLTVDHKPFRGELDVCPLVMVGDQEKCKQIAGESSQMQIDNRVYDNLKKLQYGGE